MKLRPRKLHCNSIWPSENEAADRQTEMRRTGSMGMIVRIVEGRNEQLTWRQVVEGPFLDHLRVEPSEVMSKGNDALALDNHNTEALPLRWVRRGAEGGAALEGRDGTHKDADVAVRVLRVHRLHLTAVRLLCAPRVRPSGGEARRGQFERQGVSVVPRVSAARPHGAPSPPSHLHASLIVAAVRPFQFPVAAHRPPPRHLHMHVHSAPVA